MKILLIEDEKPAVKRLLGLIKDYFPTSEFITDLDTVKKTIQWLRSHENPDLMFCDIQLADGNSFEIFEQVSVKTPVIFTTAYDQYAIKAFKVNAVDYLLKPIDPEELQRAIDKFNQQKLNQNLDLSLIQQLITKEKSSFKNRFLVKFGEKIQSISIQEVAFFYSEERVTFLQTHEGKKYVLDSTLEQVESQIDPTLFFRINRKYLCSYSSISDIFTYSNSRLKIKLINCEDQDILISRDKTSAFKSWLDG
ncbi:LytR/AlgR family response regulator transcription factor [Algoriphagus halophilus]|uniref:Two component transcriptional regulator, LytTR family n=1 Tax=Algoriphagus halophilus TaxID=226505 RepID=A0A1N6G7D9_9BACT|nr:LytTR family DNA-binding domain-containing protein [Algoriphagus halophilus]SIO03381.1 two component transcriptional regulator, LytTR family [Algoriphagus halophilus]